MTKNKITVPNSSLILVSGLALTMGLIVTPINPVLGISMIFGFSSTLAYALWQRKQNAAAVRR